MLSLVALVLLVAVGASMPLYAQEQGGQTERQVVCNDDKCCEAEVEVETGIVHTIYENTCYST